MVRLYNFINNLLKALVAELMPEETLVRKGPRRTKYLTSKSFVLTNAVLDTHPESREHDADQAVVLI